MGLKRYYILTVLDLTETQSNTGSVTQAFTNRFTVGVEAFDTNTDYESVNTANIQYETAIVDAPYTPNTTVINYGDYCRLYGNLWRVQSTVYIGRDKVRITLTNRDVNN